METKILPTCRELNIGFVPYSPLGRGFLTGSLHSSSIFAQDDARKALPRFSPGNLQANHPLSDAVAQLASNKACSPAQVALAWLLGQGSHIVPIPGTKKMTHLEDNLGAASITLTSDDLHQLEQTIGDFQPIGERYTTEGMKGVYS